jgi:hypothetical protein
VAQLLRAWRRTRPAVAAAALLLATCSTGDTASSSSDSGGPLKICAFDLKSSPTLKMSYIKFTGALFDDDIDLAEYREKGIKRVPTALARPKKTRYQAQSRQDCYNAQGKYWYPCVVQMDVDLAPAAGVTRASDMKTAMIYAVSNCERVTTQMAADAIKSGMIQSSGLECEVVEQKFCDLPAQ